MVVVRPHILVVGLGNIPFPRTRHSVGHLIVDSLAARLGVQLSRDNSPSDGFWAETSVSLDDKPFRLSLFKPMALMNILGGQVAAACRKTVSTPASMLVIHDSLDHIQATVYPKFGGSASGHRGVRSVITALKDDNFHRLRIGIGRRGDAKEYVLGPLEAFEREFWGANGQGIDVVWNNIVQVSQKMNEGG